MGGKLNEVNSMERWWNAVRERIENLVDLISSERSEDPINGSCQLHERLATHGRGLPDSRRTHDWITQFDDWNDELESNSSERRRLTLVKVGFLIKSNLISRLLLLCANEKLLHYTEIRMNSHVRRLAIRSSDDFPMSSREQFCTEQYYTE